jgi:hypothetical protein
LLGMSRILGSPSDANPLIVSSFLMTGPPRESEVFCMSPENVYFPILIHLFLVLSLFHLFAFSNVFVSLFHSSFVFLVSCYYLITILVFG